MREKKYYFTPYKSKPGRISIDKKLFVSITKAGTMRLSNDFVSELGTTVGNIMFLCLYTDTDRRAIALKITESYQGMEKPEHLRIIQPHKNTAGKGFTYHTSIRSFLRELTKIPSVLNKLPVTEYEDKDMNMQLGKLFVVKIPTDKIKE